MGKLSRSNILQQHVYARELFTPPCYVPSSPKRSSKTYLNLSERVENDGVKLVYSEQPYEITPESVASYLPDYQSNLASVATASHRGGGDFRSLQSLPKSLSELRALNEAVTERLAALSAASTSSASTSDNKSSIEGNDNG